MDNQTRQGFLVLADISGFTAYLSQVELDHAQGILAEMLETILARFKTLLTISKLEGDAVFAYLDSSHLSRGETLLELIEATYLAFRDQVEATRRRTTCTCNACRALSALDLKFFLHYGQYIVQNISGIHELIGSDVNLVHRLLKNQVTQATGWNAYLLFTAPALESLDLKIQSLHRQVEIYPHLGEVETYSYDLRPRYEVLVSARRVLLTPQDSHVRTTRDYAVPPPIVWEWLNNPAKRPQYMFGKNLAFRLVRLPEGRTGVGALTHCVHGEKVAMEETVLDWRPFEYFTVQQGSKAMMNTATYLLTPLANGGTRLEVRERGRLTSIGFLDRILFSLIATRIIPTAKILEMLDLQIQSQSVWQAQV